MVGSAYYDLHIHNKRNIGHYSNDTNLRLTEIKKLPSGNGYKFYVQKVNYFDFVHTNLVLDAKKVKDEISLLT